METNIPEGFKDFMRVVGLIVVVVLIVVTLFSLAPTSDGAKRAIEANGFTNVTVGGANPLLAGLYCSDSDSFYFNVPSATNSNGQVVSNMYVCAGFLKGYTIRNH